MFRRQPRFSADGQQMTATGVLSSVQTLRQALGELSKQCRGAPDYSGANPAVLQSIRHLLYSQFFSTLDGDEDLFRVTNSFAQRRPGEVPVSWSLTQTQQDNTKQDEQLLCKHVFSQGEPVYSCR